MKSEATDMNTEMRDNLPCLKMNIEFQFMEKSNSLEGIRVCVNGRDLSFLLLCLIICSQCISRWTVLAVQQEGT